MSMAAMLVLARGRTRHRSWTRRSPDAWSDVHGEPAGSAVAVANLDLLRSVTGATKCSARGDRVCVPDLGDRSTPSRRA